MITVKIITTVALMHFFAHDVLAVIGKLLVSYFFHHIALRFSMEHHKRVSINAPFYGGLVVVLNKD